MATSEEVTRGADTESAAPLRSDACPCPRVTRERISVDSSARAASKSKSRAEDPSTAGLETGEVEGVGSNAVVTSEDDLTTDVARQAEGEAATAFDGGGSAKTLSSRRTPRAEEEEEAEDSSSEEEEEEEAEDSSSEEEEEEEDDDDDEAAAAATAAYDEEETEVVSASGTQSGERRAARRTVKVPPNDAVASEAAAAAAVEERDLSAAIDDKWRQREERSEVVGTDKEERDGREPEGRVSCPSSEPNRREGPVEERCASKK